MNNKWTVSHVKVFLFMKNIEQQNSMAETKLDSAVFQHN